MALRTVDQIISDTITFIRNKIPLLSMLTGSVARDVVVEAPSQEFGLAWAEADRVQRQQTLADSTAFTDEELTKLASSYNIVRSEGIAATGVLTFKLSSFSVSSSDVVIPAGTETAARSDVSTTTTTSFTTAVPAVFVAANADSYFNPATGFYELDVPITASSVGTVGNVGSGAITLLITTIQGAPTVVNNVATSGGKDAETNAQLLDRILTKISGTAAGTPNGILTLVKEDPRVVDSILIRPGDEELVRDSLGNAADVNIIGESLTAVNETREYASGVVDYVLNRQPLATFNGAVTPVIVGTSGGTAFNFIEGTHFKVVVDTTSLTRNSTRAVTKIVFLGSPFPDSGSAFTVNYVINGLVESLQTTMDSDDNKIIGTDILVREAIRVSTRVGAFIKVFPGFTKSDVALSAADNVTALLNASTLNTSIQESDIIAAIQDTSGVDSVLLPISLEVKRPTDIAFAPATEVVVSRVEYARPDTAAGAIQIT